MAYQNMFAPYQPSWMQPYMAQPTAPQVQPTTPPFQPFASQPQAQQPMTGDFVVEVCGRSGAEALPLGPNSKLVAFDELQNICYRIQTDDAANKHIAEFDFTPREKPSQASPEYVTRDDFDALAAKVEALMPKPAPRTRKAAADE